MTCNTYSQKACVKYWEASEIRPLLVTWLTAIILWNVLATCWHVHNIDNIKTLLNSSSELFLCQPDPTAQSNSSPVSPESGKTSGIHLDFSPSVGQSHSDTSGSETVLCMCHCAAHLCTQMVCNSACHWFDEDRYLLGLHLGKNRQVKTLTFKSRSCLQLRLCELWPSSTS